MKEFFKGIGKALSWLFGRLPTEGQSIRTQIDKFEREFDAILEKKTSMRNVLRLKYITQQLRILYKKAANRTP